MKKIVLSGIILLVFVATCFSQDYSQRLVGKWSIMKITNSAGTQTVPAKTKATWEFMEDGTGLVALASDDKSQNYKFNWSVKDATILLTDDKEEKVDYVKFGFFDDFLFLIKAPDDNMLLQKYTEKMPDDKENK